MTSTRLIVNRLGHNKQHNSVLYSVRRPPNKELGTILCLRGEISWCPPLRKDRKDKLRLTQSELRQLVNELERIEIYEKDLANEQLDT